MDLQGTARLRATPGAWGQLTAELAAHVGCAEHELKTPYTQEN